MKKIIIILITVVILGLLAGAIWFFSDQKKLPGYIGPVETLRLGTPVQGPDLSLLIWIAEDQGYFTSNGLDVIIKSPPTTLKIQQELNAGELDLGVTTEFAYLTNLSAEDPLKAKIIATINKGESIKMVARKDKGVSAPADLKGKKIAVFRKTAQEFFLGSFLTSNNLDLNEVELIDLPPADAKNALLSGEVAAAVMSEPYVYETQKVLAENAVIWPIQNDLDFNWIVIGNDQFIKDHPEAIQRFLKALIQAEEYVAKNSGKSQELIIKKFNLEPSYPASVWPEYGFGVSLDQDLLLLMEDETRWKIENNLTTATQIPNYLNYIYFDALEKVKPEAVSIIY